MEKTRFYSKINEFLAKNFILVLIFILLFFGINHQKNQIFGTKTGETRFNKFASKSYSTLTDSVSFEMDDGATTANNAVYMKTAGVNQQNTQNNRKIVKNFNLSMVVKDVATVKSNIENELEKYKGYASNFYSYNYSNKKAINMELKIPSENVDDYLDFVKKSGYVKSESFSSTDYTEQYNDNENKLKNLYARRDKLRNMMKMEAKQLTDLLAVDKELNNTQMEIERLEKRNNKIQKDVDFSSVNITLEPEIVENTEIYHWSIKKVFNNAIDLLITFCHSAVEYVIIVGVFIPIFLALGFIILATRKVYKIIKDRKNKQ